MVLMCGWLHFKMAYANSIYKQYLGDKKGESLKKAFLVRWRKHLAKQVTKGHFHHHLNGALHSILEAYIFVDWKCVMQVSDLSELVT
jgi:hypothetical protein